jgi:hypothetical protein
VSADLVRLMRVYLAEDEHDARARALPRALRAVDGKRRIVDAYEEALRGQDGYRETGEEVGHRVALEFVVRALADEYGDAS